MRPSKDEYFLAISDAAALRATCLRRKVGAIIVVEDQVVATGYNGAPRGMPQCTDDGVGCEMEHGHCVRTVHAELNALLQAAGHGSRAAGATLYTTASPCRRCMMAIINARISRVVYRDVYDTNQGHVWPLEAAKAAGIVMTHIPRSIP